LDGNRIEMGWGLADWPLLSGYPYDFSLGEAQCKIPSIKRGGAERRGVFSQRKTTHPREAFASSAPLDRGDK